MGINNTNPQENLHFGNCELVYPNPAIELGKYNGGAKNEFIGYTENFICCFVIGEIHMLDQIH